MAPRRPDRSPEAAAYRKLYKTRRWRDLRELQLAKQPRCEACLRFGRLTAANIADHRIPHRGNPDLFFDPANLQSLCDEEPWRCHSSAKQSEERVGYVAGVDTAGRPIAPDHPWNRSRA